MDVLEKNARIMLNDSILDGLIIDITYKFKKEAFCTTSTMFICDDNDVVLNQNSFVSYMNYSDPNNVIKYLGCNAINGESFRLCLKNMPPNGKTIHFILASDSFLNELVNVCITLRNTDGERIAVFKDISFEDDDTAIIMLEFRISMNKKDWFLTPKGENLGEYKLDHIFSDLGIRTIA